MRHCQLIIAFLLIYCYSISGQLSLTAYLGGAKTDAPIQFLENSDLDRVRYLNDLYGSMVTPFLGVQLQTRIKRTFLFNINSQFSIKGQSAKNEFFDFDYRFMYMDLLPSVGMNLGKFVQLNFGPYISSRIADISKLPVNSYILGVGSRKRDYGLHGNLSIKIKRISFQISYIHGLYDVFVVSYYPRFHHRSFQLGIGYSIWQNEVRRAKIR